MIITAEQALASLRKVVAEKGPDYIDPRADKMYSACVYDDLEGTAPSCIVGHVLYDLGANKELKLIDIPSFDALGLEAIEDFESVARGDDSRDLLNVTIEEEAIEILQAAQTEQDSGYTWGFALEAAEQQAVNFGVKV